MLRAEVREGGGGGGGGGRGGGQTIVRMSGPNISVRGDPFFHKY